MTDSAEASSILQQLSAVIEDRKQNPSERSYTQKLFSGGIEKIAAKITEEAAEVNEAAAESGEAGREHLVREAADLLFHLMVMLSAREASLADVEAELARRFGVSGIEEKESRKQ